MNATVYARMILGAVRPGDAVLILTTTQGPCDEEGYRVLAVSAATVVAEESDLRLLREAAQHWLEDHDDEL